MASEAKGCGAPATRVVFRGPVRRRFLCAACPYNGSGSVKPYATDVTGVTAPTGTYTGPARRCGEEIGG